MAGAATVMEAVLLMVLRLVMVAVELLLLRLKLLPLLLACNLFFLVGRLVVVEMVEVLGFTWYLQTSESMSSGLSATRNASPSRKL